MVTYSSGPPHCHDLEVLVYPVLVALAVPPRCLDSQDVAMSW